VSIHALKSQVYLTWASPAFNPSGDKSRYDLAAKEAAYVMKHKLEKESGMAGGFDPKASLQWSDPNSPEIVFSSIPQQNSNYETALYPHGFGGMAFLGLTQEFVDAFPMANGYPINDPRSGYDSNKPYQGRDPRFYATVLYDEANVVRASNGEVMYTIEVADQGKDAVGLVDTSPTGYYLKKFIYPNWNANDATVQIPNRSNVFFRWTQMCLTFAEAANKVVGPLDKQTYGFSAKEALAYGRARTTTDGMAGLGASSDPYLDECAAAGDEKFDALVRNEWRIETCFEGRRLLDLRRWGSLSDLNVKLHGVEIYRLTNGEKGYDKFEVEERKFRSLWLPIPYQDIRKYSDLIQNQGWENFK